MGNYKFETHAHTSEVSVCGHVAAKSLVELYKNAGYAGVVVTDHYSDLSFAQIAGGPQAWADHFLAGYRAVQEAAKGQLTVLLGMEIRFYENFNDYLVFGMKESFLYAHGDLMALGIRQFCELAHAEGMLVYQAHPFRNSMTVIRPGILDGIEGFNGNPRHDSRNDVAQLWAEKFGYRMTSGSDFHEVEDVARGGIVTDTPIHTMEELLSALRAQPELIQTQP